jgi:hypothetical protein
MAVESSHFSELARCVKFRLAVAVALMACGVSAGVCAAQVDCTVQSGQLTKQVVFQASEDAYVFHKWDTPSGFRFAAQWLVPANKLKTYVYYHGSKDRYALVHAAQISVTPKNCQATTAVNQVYSERMEYELSYHCRRVCDAESGAESKDSR